jgi:hypothetical protein
MFILPDCFAATLKGKSRKMAAPENAFRSHLDQNMSKGKARCKQEERL